MPLSEAVSSVKREPGKRLVICLDGTWNNRTTSTNVFHLHNLIADHDSGGVRQIRYYSEGVGTGVLDRVTGGAFGFGLSEHVIEAYEWLIENYDDGDDIYLFGFSRGAFTARSLGGFIMKCGLLLPGAPLPVEQLWNGYRVLGRHGDAETSAVPAPNLWERIFGREVRPFRSVIELKWDTGETKAEPINRTERLLIEWSRRIPIHCIGVFDTVGSMGWDALAIPGLRTRLAAFHNTHPSKLIRHGFHALAIDENRANFRPIRWQRYVPKSGNPWARQDNWSNFEQCWFTGAHANIGGGYPDNPLSLFPLAWMVRRVESTGLAFRRKPALPSIGDCIPLKKSADCGKPFLRDSYGEFLLHFWRCMTFNHRYFRPIDPAPTEHPQFSLESLNETVDESVKAFWDADPAYRPKNLRDYFERGQVRLALSPGDTAAS